MSSATFAKDAKQETQQAAVKRAQMEQAAEEAEEADRKRADAAKSTIDKLGERMLEMLKQALIDATYEALVSAKKSIIEQLTLYAKGKSKNALPDLDSILKKALVGAIAGAAKSIIHPLVEKTIPHLLSKGIVALVDDYPDAASLFEDKIAEVIEYGAEQAGFDEWLEHLIEGGLSKLGLDMGEGGESEGESEGGKEGGEG
jgi:hypothetical protein